MGVTQYAWLLSLQPYDSVDTIDIDVSDAAFSQPTKQWQPGVQRWDRYALGAAAWLGNAYFQPRMSIALQVRSYGEQPPDDNLITLLQSRDFVNAKATLSVIDIAAPGAVLTEAFGGVVKSVRFVDRNEMQIDLEGEDATRARPVIQMTEALYPDGRQADNNTFVPITAGETGWTAPTVLRDMKPDGIVAGLETTQDWRWLVPSRGMSPSPIIDVKGNASGVGTGYDALISSVSAGQPGGWPGPLNVVLWPDDPRSPIELLEAAQLSGVLHIPRELAANYPNSVQNTAGPPQGGPQDGQIRGRRLHVPNELDDPTIADWNFPQNGIDRTNFASYAEAITFDAWYRSAGRFVRYPSRPYLMIARADGADPRVVALVWGKSLTDTNLIWEIEIKVNGRTNVQFTVDLSAAAAGWAIISWPINDQLLGFRGIDDFISFEGTNVANRKWYGENVDPLDQLPERIGVRASNGATAAAEAPRVSLIGLMAEHLLEPGPLTALTKSGYLRGIEIRGDQARPAEVLSAQTNPSGPGAFAAMFDLMVDGSVDAVTPIISTDFNVGSGVGSWLDFDAAMNASVNAATGGEATNWLLSAAEQNDLTLAQMIGKAANNFFADIWYSPRTRLYNAQIFQAGQAPHGARLTFDDMEAEMIQLQGGDAEQVYTAIYLDCWNGTRTVSIDNTALKSRTFDGSQYPAGEAEADALQAIYGRNPLRASMEYIRDPAMIWDELLRMWGLVRDIRPTCRFHVGPAWGLAREQSEVIETDAELDAIMPVPVRGKTTWDDLTWQIKMIEIEPRGGCWVTATWNDPFTPR